MRKGNNDLKVMLNARLVPNTDSGQRQTLLRVCLLWNDKSAAAAAADAALCSSAPSTLGLQRQLLQQPFNTSF
jgi:hypothetical protein